MNEIRINRDRFTEMMEIMCDEFCHWPIESVDQDVLNRHCEECPINNIECDDFWEDREKNG